MNIAQQVIASLPREDSDSVTEMFQHARISSIDRFKQMPDKFWLDVVEQYRKYILFTDGSKICFHRDQALVNKDWSPRMRFPIILFWIMDSEQVSNPKPAKFKSDSQWRCWIN